VCPFKLPIRLFRARCRPAYLSGQIGLSRRRTPLENRHPSRDSAAASDCVRLRRKSAAKTPMNTLFQFVSAFLYPAYARSRLRGLSGARRHGVVLLRLRRLSGHGSSLKGALQESTTWHLGAGPTRLAPPGVTRARSGNSKKEYHHVSKQSKPHRLSRQRC